MCIRDSNSIPATVTLSTLNSKPVAVAGPDQNALTGATVTLDGSASHDADNDALTYQWSLTARPTGSATQLANPTQARTTLIPDLAGTYLAQLIVNDGHLDSDPDSALVTVTAAPPTNHPPTIASTALTAATVNPVSYTHLDVYKRQQLRVPAMHSRPNSMLKI